jgi:hypothetical protein
MDSRSMSFKDIQKSEEAEASTSGQENSLESMFSLSRSQSINHANIEEVEINPQATLKLPTINPSKVHLKIGVILSKNRIYLQYSSPIS